jgi:hypothetical protein
VKRKGEAGEILGNGGRFEITSRGLKQDLWAPSGFGVGGSSSHYQIACHVLYLFIWCTLKLNSPAIKNQIQ